MTQTTATALTQALAAARKIYNPKTETFDSYQVIEDGTNGMRLMALAGIDRVTTSDDDDAADGCTHRYLLNGEKVGAEIYGSTVIYI